MDRAGSKRYSGNRYSAGPATLPGLKAEALRLADRSTGALEAIDKAKALVERFENRYWCTETHRLRGVILAALSSRRDAI